MDPVNQQVVVYSLEKEPRCRGVLMSFEDSENLESAARKVDQLQQQAGSFYQEKPHQSSGAQESGQSAVPEMSKPPQKSNSDSTPIEVQAELHQYTGDLSESQKRSLKIVSHNENEIVISHERVPDVVIAIRRQDIFKSGAEVIVNAANTDLGGGGGIDGVIHVEGGPSYKTAQLGLQSYYRKQKFPGTSDADPFVSGHAAMIDSGLLRKKYKIQNVIVVAGPQGSTNSEKENQLYSCYYNSVVVADKQHKVSIAFPSISTGLFFFPKGRAASISLKAVFDFIEKHSSSSLKTITIHFLTKEPKKETLDFYLRALGDLPKSKLEQIVPSELPKETVKAVDSLPKSKLLDRKKSSLQLQLRITALVGWAFLAVGAFFAGLNTILIGGLFVTGLAATFRRVVLQPTPPFL